jgi:uncharacterized protein YjbI with pentapeptide repeats
MTDELPTKQGSASSQALSFFVPDFIYAVRSTCLFGWALNRGVEHRGGNRMKAETLVVRVAVLVLCAFLGSAWRLPGADMRRAGALGANVVKQTCNRILPGKLFYRSVLGAALAVPLSMNPLSCTAVSGGGKDFATENLKGRTEFAGADLRSKDFTQSDAKGVSFAKSKLAGSRFYRAKLENAVFDGAQLQSASLEDSDLAGASFTDAVLTGSYISASFENVASIQGADFTDALLPEKTQRVLCARPDASGTNSITCVATRESLLCPE